MGINQVAGISGQFIGLILGGVLAAVDWRLVFLVFAAAATYTRKLPGSPPRRPRARGRSSRRRAGLPDRPVTPAACP
jgi:MFS family permease